jgi:hypothetical protein
MNEPPEASSAIEPPPPVGIETAKQEPIAPPAPSKEGASKPDAMKAIRIGDKGVPPRVFNTVPISQRDVFTRVDPQTWMGRRPAGQRHRRCALGQPGSCRIHRPPGASLWPPRTRPRPADWASPRRPET